MEPPSKHKHRQRTQFSIYQDRVGDLFVICNVCGRHWYAGNYHAKKAAYTSDAVVMRDAERRCAEAQGG